MFDNIEDCFLFKNDLDHEVEGYELERDKMLEFRMVKEFTTNTQMAEAYTSLFPPITQQLVVLSDQNEGSTCIFVVGSQDKLVVQDFQDPFDILLQAPEKMNVG